MFGRFVLAPPRRVAAVSTVGLVLGFVGFFVAPAVQASAGSYSLNFAAADPLNYDKWQPSQHACPAPSNGTGTAANPLADAAFGNPKVYVESLTPKDLALGQIVAFETKISVSGSTSPENGVISFAPTFGANTTSHDDFGFDTSWGLYCAFVDTADTATSDPGHDAKVTTFSSTTIGSGTGNEQIAGVVNVAGLDDGDSVVVELWVVLDKTIPGGANGNVQSELTSAVTGSNDKINTGSQVVPLKNVQNFFTDSADLSVTKSDSPDPVLAGHQLTYTVTVHNTSPDTVSNGVVLTDSLDPSTTFVSASGATCTTKTSAAVPPVTTVTCDVGSLAPGASAMVTIVVTVSTTAPDVDKTAGAEAGAAGSTCTGTHDLCNVASVTATTADGNSTNNAYAQPTNVTPVAGGLSIDKTVLEPSYSKVGDVLHYSYLVTNTGNVTLTNAVTVTDDKTTVTCPALPVGGLAPGATITCAATYAISQADLNAGHVTNTAYAASGAVRSATDSTTVNGVQTRTLSIDKTVRESTYIQAGDQLHYSYVVTNTGTVTLTDPITVTDTKVSVTCPALPAGGLAPGVSLTCSATYTVTANDVAVGSVTNSAFAQSGTAQSPPDSVTVPVTRPTPAQVGHVTVVKQLAGDIAGAETSFTFGVLCSASGYAGALTIDAATGSGSASTPDVIPLGTTCQITESGTYAHWTLTSATPSSPTAPGVATAVATQGTSTANTATFVNTRAADPVTVQKTRIGDVAGAATDFVFQLTCPAYVTAAGPTFPWAQQTLTVDTSSTATATAVSSPIPTGVSCQVAEVPTAGWQQTDPAAGAGVPVTANATATFVNTRNAGALQVVKSAHTLLGPNANVGSYLAGDPANTVVYTLTLSEASPAQLVHTGVLVSDYLPGYGPDAGKVTATYVPGSATCSTGCSVSYDAVEHQLTWNVGTFGPGDDPVVMTFRVTIDSPTPAANGAIPVGTLTNVGWVQSLQQADTPSNEVGTPVTAVEGEKHHVNPPLPFTGASVPLPLAGGIALVLIVAGAAMTLVRRREQIK